ncbi:Voltage-dependent T-type calcium channel subunit alpha-1I (Ca(v)3.3) like [Actinidia chinensis var. chinensis]|uniref:Voltage-dependent T-type calcium channel subunit alpha-1I (Ca(V)3.3) like n=1 Tax=Actinidia chinensis var. chinensis TaxID=1590841 RepID=A0A2R6PQ36_ACTCC|nr:Voltage-dependent T-type calcium channel subunit alpha-1I (Ca(v)3.3) like [Actinidia chinensis var. chinensis]
MELVQGMLGRVGRQCYAVFCLGVLLISVAIAHYACASELDDLRDSAQRRRPTPTQSY